MGRCPMLIVLAIETAIILLADMVGWRKPQQAPAYGANNYCAIIQTTREASTSGQLLIGEIDSVGGKEVSPFKARIHIVSETPEVISGQRIKFTGKLQPLQAPPAVPDIVDLQKNLRRQGVVASIVVSRDSIEYIASANRVQEWFASANNALLTRLKRAPLNAETIDVLAAMILGRGEMLPSDMRAGYSAAGMSHVLALSGMHVGVIAMIISLVLWPFYLGRHVRTRLLLTILALWFYAALTGFIPSVTRSVIMATVYMFGIIIERKSSALNSLCLAAIIIMLFAPEDIYSAGFQLSFAAVLGIILFYPLINRIERREYPKLYATMSYPALTLSAMSLSGLVSAFHFHSFPLCFLLANLMIVPIIPLLLFSGIMAIIFEANFGADYLCGMMNRISMLFSELPSATLSNLYPEAWLVLVLLGLLVIHAYAAHLKKKFLWIESALLFAGIMACCAVKPQTEYPEREVYEIAEAYHQQTIVATKDSCYIFTTAKLPSEREEIEQRYQLILRDFVAKRNISRPILK